jgi:hypothetical protein
MTYPRPFLLGCLVLSFLGLIGIFLAIAKRQWWLLPVAVLSFGFAEISLREGKKTR